MVTAVVKQLTETLKFNMKKELEERNDCRCGVGYVIMLTQLSFQSNEGMKLNVKGGYDVYHLQRKSRHLIK